jgi:hypothetical protein
MYTVSTYLTPMIPGLGHTQIQTCISLLLSRVGVRLLDAAGMGLYTLRLDDADAFCNRFYV